MMGKFRRDLRGLRREPPEICRQQRKERFIQSGLLREAQDFSKSAQQPRARKEELQRERPPEAADGRVVDAGGRL